jgi:cytochrome P450
MDHGSKVLKFLSYAAFETSESSTRAILCALMRDPVRYRTLQQEIRSNFSASKPITDSQLVGLPYLTACINEGLRLWPGLNGQFTSRVSTGAVVDGVYVPPGVRRMNFFPFVFLLVLVPFFLGPRN